MMGLFRRNCTEFGFQISVGKNYVSKDCCQINSQIFIRKNGLMVRKSYLNLRLVEGVNHKESDCSSDPIEVSRSIKKMVDLCPITVSAVPYAMMRVTEKHYKDQRFQPNWYIPVELGGLGLPIEWAPKDHKITKDQLHVASCFRNDPLLALFRKGNKGKPKYDFSKLNHLTLSLGVYGDYVPEEGYSQINVDDVDDGWTSLAMIYELVANRTEPRNQTDEVYLMKILTNKSKVNRLEPMSLETLHTLMTSNYRIYVKSVLECPQLQSISYSEMNRLYRETLCEAVDQ